MPPSDALLAALSASVANLIVAESALKRGEHISFGVFLRVGAPITLLTLALGVGWLTLISR